jgi:hypothetical protein
VIPGLGARMNQQEQFVSLMIIIMMMMTMMTTTKVTEMTITVSTVMPNNDGNIFRYTVTYLGTR